MNSKKLIVTIAASALLLSGCVFKDNHVILKVNGHKITQAQFDEAFNSEADTSMFANMGIDVKKDKNNFLYLMLKDKVVSELVVKSLINDEIQKRHIKITRKDMDNEFANIIDKVGSKEKFDEILKQNNIPFSKFKKDLKEEVTMKKLVATIKPVKITEADARDFYNKNTGKFKYPDKVRASHILISANSEEIKEKLLADPANKKLSKEEINAKVAKELAVRLEKAKKILAEVKKDPSSFEKIAKENSDDTKSAKQGGDLGYFAKNEMVEPFSKAAFSQKPNTISDIVQTPYGYHIILVKDRMRAGQEAFKKVKNEIMFYLENQEDAKVIDNLVKSLKQNAKIEYVNPEYNPSNIQEVLKKQEKTNPNVKQELHPESQSATPAPEKAKK